MKYEEDIEVVLLNNQYSGVLKEVAIFISIFIYTFQWNANFIGVLPLICVCIIGI